MVATMITYRLDTAVLSMSCCIACLSGLAAVVYMRAALSAAYSTLPPPRGGLAHSAMASL